MPCMRTCEAQRGQHTAWLVCSPAQPAERHGKTATAHAAAAMIGSVMVQQRRSCSKLEAAGNVSEQLHVSADAIILLQLTNTTLQCASTVGHVLHT